MTAEIWAGMTGAHATQSRECDACLRCINGGVLNHPPSLRHSCKERDYCNSMCNFADSRGKRFARMDGGNQCSGMAMYHGALYCTKHAKGCKKAKRAAEAVYKVTKKPTKLEREVASTKGDAELLMMMLGQEGPTTGNAVQKEPQGVPQSVPQACEQEGQAAGPPPAYARGS